MEKEAAVDEARRDDTIAKMNIAKLPGTVNTAPRRIVTAPVHSQASRADAAPSTPQPGGIETLYSHPSVKIIAFTAGPRTFDSPGRTVSSPIEVEPGSLSWSSQLERTIAVGPFRIYRAPGSVAFLNCGSALQPILPKSQCWCIDECSSKFVLQIRRPQYWRIEIAVDVEKAQALRDVFDKILQFEKTPCPFQRAFTVELPQRPQTSVKKRPWTPVQRKPSLQFPPTPVTPEAEPPIALMGKRSSDFYKQASGSPAENATTPTLPAIQKTRRRNSASAKTEGSEETPTPTLTPDLTATLIPVVQGNIKTEPLSQDSSKTNIEPILAIDAKAAITRHHLGFQASRSVTAPPQLSLLKPSSKPCTETCELGESHAEDSEEQNSEPNSPTDSSASFHSLQSWHSSKGPLPPSPPLSNPNSPRTFPYPHENIPLPQPVSSRVQLEDKEPPMTALRQSFAEGDLSHTIAPHEDASVDESSLKDQSVSVSSDCISETSASHASSCEDTSQRPHTPATAASTSTDLSRRPRIRHRPTTSSISVSRALSPLPSAANLFSPHNKFRALGRPTTRLQAVSRIPGAIIHKTCEILLSPPSHLINLMLNVAARITGGEWRGFVFGVGESGEQIPVQWDYSDSSDTGSTTGRCWEVNDDDDAEGDDVQSWQESRISATDGAKARIETALASKESAVDDCQGWEVD
ncbi:uncharacterized protein PpBr36_06672 [Pyricularia pennisetigena]|uniref:uncharacterized protein n=1 Tax=Pyricularia pennisetigena TaxID=1578925 RepID=UPI0011525CFC|nr:uncharacterized protein PpBr36_06672 [Pyricularia pennisetigena]TLS23138.1 hypothetical protein PpBr36_06672 [Pyricularia pennisetigena]